ncbi:MAG: hypothetical protein NTX59_12515 [Elusimicrobia bacterium]|nr:hypothetical protein [Elusimicrobiota bacterium]
MKKTIRTIIVAAVPVLFSGALMAGEAENRSFDTRLDISGIKASEAAVPIPVVPAAAPRSGDAAPFFNYLNSMFSAPRAVPEVSGVNEPASVLKEAALYTIELGKVKNQYLMPAFGFKTSKGAFVHISGTKATNCPDGGNSCDEKEKFFLTLTPDNGQTQFARVMDIINVFLLYSGSRDLTIDGETFTVLVDAVVSHPEKSIIEVKKGSSKIFAGTLGQMGSAIADKGVDVNLSRAYKLAYGNELTQVKGGAAFTGKMLILMMPFPVVDASNYYIFSAADMMSPGGVSYPSMEAGYKFRISGGMLEISRL